MQGEIRALIGGEYCAPGIMRGRASRHCMRARISMHRSQPNKKHQKDDQGYWLQTNGTIRQLHLLFVHRNSSRKGQDQCKGLTLDTIRNLKM